MGPSAWKILGRPRGGHVVSSGGSAQVPLPRGALPDPRLSSHTPSPSSAVFSFEGLSARPRWTVEAGRADRSLSPACGAHRAGPCSLGHSCSHGP